jgi:hypothetical protein
MHGSQITCGCVYDSLLLIECSSLTFYRCCCPHMSIIVGLVVVSFRITFVLILLIHTLTFNIPLQSGPVILFDFLILFSIFGTWVINGLNCFNHKVSHTDHMHFPVHSITSTPHIPIK